VARLLTALARERRAILEAGANIGYYTLLMATAQPKAAWCTRSSRARTSSSPVRERHLNALTSVR
jgi:predicted O-methyltransferase YrrM